MDRVRFGRALGYGARHAARAVVQAANAAAAPSPSGPLQSQKQPAAAPTRVEVEQRSQVPPAARGKVTGSSRAGGRVFQPIKRYSGTVLLQVVGTFFAVFALLMMQNAWKLRAGFQRSWSSPEAGRAWLMVGLFLLFSWFAISSFLRARRLERG